MLVNIIGFVVVIGELISSNERLWRVLNDLKDIYGKSGYQGIYRAAIAR